MSNIGDNSGIPSLSDEDVKNVVSAIKTINDSMMRIDSERDLIKETVNKLHEELQFPKRLLRRLAKTHYLNSFEADVEEDRQFEETYERINNKK